MTTPTRAASFSAASVKVRFSVFITKEKASPPSPQPKQWKVCRSGLTVNEGLRSWWNGQRAFRLRPARVNGTHSPTSSTMSSRVRMSSKVSGGIMAIGSREKPESRRRPTRSGAGSRRLL